MTVSSHSNLGLSVTWPQGRGLCREGEKGEGGRERGLDEGGKMSEGEWSGNEGER